MKKNLEFKLNKAQEFELSRHLFSCDKDFVPPLSKKVDINIYSKKIIKSAIRFEAWSQDMLIGCLAMYADYQNNLAYITNVSVLKSYWGLGIASRLLSQCVEFCKKCNLKQVSLEVNLHNLAAIHLYEKFNFVQNSSKNDTILMTNIFDSQHETKKKL